jgi:hypothetical protein
MLSLFFCFHVCIFSIFYVTQSLCFSVLAPPLWKCFSSSFSVEALVLKTLGHRFSVRFLYLVR